MLPPSSVTPSLLLLLLLLLGPQLPLSSAKNQGADRGVPAAPSRSHRSREKAGNDPRGVVYLRKEKMKCTWQHQEEPAGTVRIQVACKSLEGRKDRELRCAYRGSPARCPGYQSEPRTFWKQVNRGLGKLRGKLCTDPRALLMAGMCKRAPLDSHFRMEQSPRTAPSPEQPRRPETPKSRETPRPKTSVTPQGAERPRSPGSTSCPGDSGHRQKAEEKCGSSWASVCAFFFSILQSDEC